MTFALVIVKPRQQRKVYCAKEGLVLLRVGATWDILSFAYHEPATMLSDRMAHKRKLKVSLLRGEQWN